MSAKAEEIIGQTGMERWKAVSELKKMGRPAVEYLIINLWDTDKRVRMAAVDALGAIGDHRAYEHLVKMLDDPDHDVRFASAIALGELGDKRAIEPLSKACNDPNCYVRTMAEESLIKIRSKN
ncbi:MAG: HEAT repeat domain-containing protein [Methanoregulaceae archaeon]|nr:HEAT repeat domain-containing protein [Methanoregulaceae archaeon]MCU0628813.1 HEAT repeat domain-containing protein [Methanoregulaceae archaeon]